MRSYIVLSTLVLLTLGFQAFGSPQPEDASIIRLIANPKEYDGKIVRLIGYVNLEFEGNAIYLHKEDCKRGIDANGLWLNVDEQVRKNRKRYHHKYILIEGTFDAKDKGHLNGWPGAVGKITRWYIWQ